MKHMHGISSRVRGYMLQGNLAKCGSELDSMSIQTKPVRTMYLLICFSMFD
jgi:hypothetical protein